MTNRPWWNEAIREQRAFEAWLNRREAQFANRLARAKNRYIKAVAASIARGEGEQQIYTALHADEVLQLLAQTYRSVIPERGRVTLGAIQTLKQKRMFDWGELFADLVQDWIASQALIRARSIAETTKKDVRRVIDEGLREGYGTEKVAGNIRGVTALSLSRARTIARTELHAAALFANEATAKNAETELGIRLIKYWVPTLDDRTRDSHAEMANADGVPLDEMFNVGGTMMSRPGDPAGGASNVCNCRCSLIHREQQFEIN